MADSPILQRDGTPFPSRPPAGPRQAAATLGGVRSPMSGHPAEGLTPARLAAIHRAAASGDPLAYFELAEDIEERDPHYLAVLSTRKRQVSQIPITVEPAGDDETSIKHADFVREWLALDVLQGAMFDLLDAIGKGLSILEIEWETRRGWVAPRALHWSDPRYFDLDEVSLDEPRLRDGAGSIPLESWRYVVHRHKSKSGLTIRSGIARAASWAWMYKAFTLRDWAIFAQNYGMPIRIGKYHSGATEDEKDTLMRALAGLSGDLAAIIDERMLVELIELRSTMDGSKLYEQRSDWMDRQISKLVLGQTATTDAAPGSHAIGGTHRLVQEDLERFDAQLVEATVNPQVIKPMVIFTFGAGVKKFPILKIGRPDEIPIETIITAVKELGPLGLKVEASQILDRLGLTEAETEPKDGKPVDIIGGRQPPAAHPSDDAPVPPGKKPDGLGDLKLNSRMLHGLFDLHARQREPEYVERLTAALAQDAAGALAGVKAEIRAEFEAAEDLPDLMSRLERLQLGPDELREAMARGMALANLVGRAAVLDELREG